jgi:peptide/nickel transport system ATP-binding protein
MSDHDESEALLSVREVVVDFPIRGDRRRPPLRAVDHVSFSIRAGETLGIAGESGSGKTTLALAIIGQRKIDGGDVRFMGQRVANLRGRALRALRAKLQFIFQDPATTLNPRHRAWEIVSEPLLVHGIERNRDKRRAAAGDLLELCGLGRQSVDRFPGEFSGGQQQRIGIARALALDPALVIADEPTSALDVSVQAQIINLMRDVQAEKNVGYLFISHNLAVLRQVSDRVAIMRQGRVVEIGECHQIFTRPQHDYTRRLLASVPSFVHARHGGVRAEPQHSQGVTR